MIFPFNISSCYLLVIIPYKPFHTKNVKKSPHVTENRTSSQAYVRGKHHILLSQMKDFYLFLLSLTCLNSIFSERRRVSVTTLNRPQSTACVDRRRNKARHGCACYTDCNIRYTLFHMLFQTHIHTLTKVLSSYLPSPFNYISHSSNRTNYPASGCSFCFLQKHPATGWEHL